MLMTPAEYMAIDSQLLTSDSLSDSQIIEMVTSSSQSSQAGSDEDKEGEEESASLEEERVCVYLVYDFFYNIIQHSG